MSTQEDISVSEQPHLSGESLAGDRMKSNVDAGPLATSEEANLIVTYEENG